MPNYCTIPDCDQPVRGHGYCRLHYQRWVRGSSLTAPKKPYRANVDIWSLIDPCRTDGCWQWTGYMRAVVYGGYRLDGKAIYAHHLFVPCPKGMERDHLCHNRGCVNPAHIEVVTHAVNVSRERRTPQKLAGHCTHGHEYTPENSLPAYGRSRHGACRTCHNAAQARRYARIKENH